ncbi:hypothetical protein ASG62_16150 [Aureimonas sp. Leaf427]|uniref:hypothetical protein n=2 Tax=unclassified Aureimonas TaxID=2615206 RepID=UPI00070E8528|nr:hypothetical protein [Aureimonas sp. Leaf460]KQT52189.1 hypothetical protein ASG62_16150 [Aureimonas sp. Leaf427]
MDGLTMVEAVAALLGAMGVSSVDLAYVAARKHGTERNWHRVETLRRLDALRRCAVAEEGAEKAACGKRDADPDGDTGKNDVMLRPRWRERRDG